MSIKSCTAILLLVLCCPVSWGQAFFISGKVVETGSRDADKPVDGATVELFDAKSTRITSTLTNKDGVFLFYFRSKPAFKGQEFARISKAGYSKDPTIVPVTLKHPEGETASFQGVIPLTDLEAIRSNPEYRKQVAINAEAASTSGQKEKANSIYASIAGLPASEKQLVFSSVKQQSAPAYSELLRVNEELVKANELERSVLNTPTSMVDVLRFDPSGTIRFTGTVGTLKDMNAILKQANDKGFTGSKIVNEMRVVQRAP